MFLCYIVSVLMLCHVAVRGLEEGKSCTQDGKPGVCKNLLMCNSALEAIERQEMPEICTFDMLGNTVVCCIEENKPSTTTTTTTTTEASMSNIGDKFGFDDEEEYFHEDDECKPIDEHLTSKKTGQKAWDKCIEYQDQYVYPCVQSASILGGKTRTYNCHQADKLIVGGKEAKSQEFPHMVLLGYGDDPETVQYKCGGSIISDRFILTAGHCTSDENFNVSYVATGRLTRSEPYDAAKVYKVSRIIKHPHYRPPNKHNDIALLETERRIALDSSTIPACIHIGNTVDDEEPTVTGWGLVKHMGREADVLQKVRLNKFTAQECTRTYRKVRLMNPGYDANTQLCFGHRTDSRDACQGDSGGPLQIKNNDVNCMYTIIGITSFGRGCGTIGEPAIYTRVSTYLSWIEDIVWP